jgi:hypothetical protein
MAYEKSSLLTILQSFCHSMADASMISQFYNDIVDELPNRGAGQLGHVRDATTITAVDGTKAYSFPTYFGKPVFLFYSYTPDGIAFVINILQECSLSDLETYSKTWRSNAKGNPIFYTMEDQAVDKFMVYPTPLASGTISGNFLLYYTLDSAGMSLAGNGEPYWLSYAIIHEIIHREFARPSDHQDIDYAEANKMVANLIYNIVGVQTGEKGENK